MQLEVLKERILLIQVKTHKLSPNVRQYHLGAKVVRTNGYGREETLYVIISFTDFLILPKHGDPFACFR
jgi:hypothetical protein